jgi:hypothetical protein
MEPNRWMLWQKPNSTWAWKLIPSTATGPPHHTTQRPLRWRTSPGNALLSLILFELGDFPMTRKLLLGVKRRAEEVANAAAQAGG